MLAAVSGGYQRTFGMAFPILNGSDGNAMAG
jgi:hypothetical protein